MIKKKLYIIIGLFVFVVLFLLVFTYSYFKQRSGEVVSPAPINNPVVSDLKPQTEAELQNDIDNFNQAQAKQDVSLCQAVQNGQSKDFCVQEIAISTQNTSFCLSIASEPTKEDCVSHVLSKVAVANNSLLDCQKIKQAMIAKDCVEKIASLSVTIDCKALTDANLANSCLSLVYYNQAKAKNDSKICNLIPELIRKANCLSEVEKIDLHSDADKDGLDFLQEILNNTNPNKADTDSDGHLDGEEVKSGFNPDGLGMISEIKPITSVNCQDISDNGIRSLCLLELKDKPLDYSKCNLIKNLTLKKYCLDLEEKAVK